MISARRLGWVWSQDRETPAPRATESKVTGDDAVPGLGPLGLGQRPLVGDGHPLAPDVDLGGRLPAAPDGLVGDPRVMGRHLVRVVVEEDTDDPLRDVAVHQPGGERVPPLVRGQVNRQPVLVPDVTPQNRTTPAGRKPGADCRSRDV